MIITLLPLHNQAQIPNLRSLSSFVCFTTTGAVTNAGVSSIKGDIGTGGGGAVSGFAAPFFIGSIYIANSITAQATSDLTLLYNELNAAVPTATHGVIYGHGETLFPGIYLTIAATSIVDTINLDANGNTDAVFTFKIQGAFSTGAVSIINLKNGAKASNIFWLVEGAIYTDENAEMKGTLLSHNGAISMVAGSKLDGRLLSTTGAIAVSTGSYHVIPAPCAAGFSKWLGVDNNWQNINNWCGGVPLITTNILIPSSLNAYPVINNGTANFNNINIESGAFLTISGTGGCNIFGAITNAGIFDITDGTLNLAGSNVSLGGSNILNGTVKNLYISSGAATSITSGSTNMLSVKNNLSFLNSNNTLTTNGNLTLLSTATNTASVTDITDNGTLTGNRILGNAYVERFIPSLKRWRYLAINTKAGTGSKNTVQANWMEGQPPGVNGGGAGKGLWITDAGYTSNPANYDATSFTPSMKWFNGTAYIGIGNPINYDIRSHGAYFTYIRGDRGCTAANGILSTTVIRTFGNLIQGDTIVTISSDISGIGTGNPYASAIDLRKVSYSDNDNVNIFVWDPNLVGGYGQGGFQTLSRSSNSQDFTIIPGGGSYGANSIVNTIESGLGFFIQGALTSRNLTFKESSKNIGIHNAFRTPVLSQKVYARLSVRALNDSLTMLDAFEVNFASNFNTGLDNNDARKKSGSYESIASIREGTLLAIEYRNSMMSINDSLLISSKNLIAKNYCLSITITSLIEPGRKSVLVDKFLGTETLLNLDSITNYNFTVTTALASFDVNRFLIIFRQTEIIPIEHIVLAANRMQNGDILIKWVADNEKYIDHYETEKSIDTNSFTKLGTNISAVNSNAEYLQYDKGHYSSNNFYRIKAIKINSEIIYSNVVNVTPLYKAQSISVYPNPINNQTIHLFLSGLTQGNYKCALTDENGKIIYNGNVNVNGPEIVKEILLKGNIASGNYLLIIFTTKGFKKTISVSIIN